MGEEKVDNIECGILGCPDVDKCLTLRECLHGELPKKIGKTDTKPVIPETINIRTFDMECAVLGCPNYDLCLAGEECLYK